MNKVILTGRLCDEPELKYVGENNIPVTKFTIAVKREYKNNLGEYDADFIDCELWSKRAEIFCQYMKKGDLFAVEGKLKLDKFISSTGENRRKIIVNGTNFDFLSKKNCSENIINADSIFESEDNIANEFSESDIPF